MTAVEELEQAAEVQPDVPSCEAYIPVFLEDGAPPELMRCPEPAVALVEGRCRCGHVSRAWLCEWHAVPCADDFCRACHEDAEAPHRCLLTVLVITGGGRG